MAKATVSDVRLVYFANQTLTFKRWYRLYTEQVVNIAFKTVYFSYFSAM